MFFSENTHINSCFIRGIMHTQRKASFWKHLWLHCWLFQRRPSPTSLAFPTAFYICLKNEVFTYFKLLAIDKSRAAKLLRWFSFARVGTAYSWRNYSCSRVSYIYTLYALPLITPVIALQSLQHSSFPMDYFLFTILSIMINIVGVFASVNDYLPTN